MNKNLVFALAGNPNCGKTSLFNELTGARQHVGNWPGVTVEKKRVNSHQTEEILLWLIYLVHIVWALILKMR